MRNEFRVFLWNSILLVIGALFFALSHPNFIFLNGFPFLAYFSFVPLFILLRRVRLRYSFLWGALYGAFSYFLFGFWLIFFHPLAIKIVVIYYFFLFMLLCPLLKIADTAFPKYGFIVQWIIFVSYEYVKTLGFMGFSYGITGYTQWELPAVIQIASLFGVWAVSALVLFPSVLLAAFFNFKSCINLAEKPVAGKGISYAIYKNAAIAWFICFLCCLIFGYSARTDYTECQNVKVALIQHNEDPWAGGSDSYRDNFEKLRNLSDAALKAHPDIKLIVWPETAFVPRIEWHYKYRENDEIFELVSDLLSYMDSSSSSFLIGNDDAVFQLKENTSSEFLTEEGRTDYNAALLFTPGKNIIPPKPERYRKIRLVPFTETFPYKKIFPCVYEFLLKNDTHFWEKGEEEKVFVLDKLKFSVPICFEDTFGYISGNFANNGAEIIINITNDAWAGSAACQYQHLSMAVFRAVETRRPILRSASSGQTAYIDMNGKIVEMLPAFTENFLAVQVPIAEKPVQTLYMKYGDSFGVCALCLSCLILIFVFVKYIMSKLNCSFNWLCFTP